MRADRHRRGTPRWQIEDVLPENHSFDGFQVEHEFPHIGHKAMLLNARRIRKPSRSELILPRDRRHH
jgi:hypothetical protein